VEYRDEVFARLAMDLAQAGMRVVRAKTAAEAIPLFARHAPALVLANLDMPDQSGWLLAAKLRFICPHTRVWLYHPWTSQYAEGMATFLKVDELLEYGGDLLGLSEAVIALVAMHQRRGHARKALHPNEGQTAA
jgi:response regulator RpfG family c-di-GMP phosphodiesterase